MTIHRDPTSIPPLFAGRAHTPARPTTARSLAGARPSPQGNDNSMVVPELSPEQLEQIRQADTARTEALQHAQHVLTGHTPVSATPPDTFVLTPTGEAAPAQADITDPISWSQVQDIRLAVTEAFRVRLPVGTKLDPRLHAELIDILIEEQITDWRNRVLSAGGDAITGAQARDLHIRVARTLLGAGRLQPLLDLPGLEDLQIEGNDNVWAVFADGRLEQLPPVTDTDEELIAEIQHIARTNPDGEKQFSPAHKKLRMALPDGSRLAAEAWLTPRPSVTIRKHRFIDTDLDESLRLGAIDYGLAQFLGAAARAGRTIIVSGSPAAGKTTLARAILAALDPRIRLATIETQYELGVHKMPARHPRVWAAEAQEGGEADANGNIIGAVTLSDLVEASLQKSVERIIIGEIVGDEIAALLEALQAGKGGLATIHANSANDTVERMVTLITRARANVGTDYASRLVAQNVDLVVHLASIDERHLPGGRMHRFVDEVVALELGGEAGIPVQRTTLYAPGPDGRAVPTGNKPPWLTDLQRHGFDPAWLTAGDSSWGAPLDLKVPFFPGIS